MAYIYMCRQSAPLVGAAPDITETVWKPISLQMLKMCSWQNTSSWSRQNGNNYHHTSLSLLLTYEPLLLPRPDLKIPQLWNIRARFTARQMKLGWRPRTAPSQAHRHHYLRGRRTGTTFMLHIAADVILEAMSWIRNKESDVSANRGQWGQLTFELGLQRCCGKGLLISTVRGRSVWYMDFNGQCDMSPLVY